MSQPDTPEQPDTESQKTAVPQPEMQPETLSETPSEPQEPAQWQPEKHRFGSIGILAASAIGVVFALYAFRLPPFGMGEVYTNNAYVRGSVTAVSPRVGGYVQAIPIAFICCGKPSARAWAAMCRKCWCAILTT